MEKAFEDNKVLLWGEVGVKKSLLDKYDKGNKNPYSTTRKKEDIKPKKEVKKEYSVDEEYNINDLPFLNKEYDRIEELLSKTNDMDELDELTDIQDKLYDLIEGLEHMKKISGGRIAQGYELKEDVIRPDIYKNLVGRGFKKGSPEAIAHAEKMRKAIENKPKTEKIIKSTKSTKSRVVKGSEEAKALGRKMAEAKKKKLEEAKKLIETKTIEPKEEKGKPWFYIGDIPKGYREATEDEAILSKKVSYYGKYQVDEEKWRLFKDYNILLSRDKTNKEIEWSMSGLKRRIMEALENIEIYSSKVDNDKYKDRKKEFFHKLEDEKEKRKYLQAGYNWYYKLLCERTGKKYERQKFTLPQKVLNVSKESNVIEFKEQPRPIDPRTGKPTKFGDLYIDKLKNEEPIKEEAVKDVELWFNKDGNNIKLSTKYFTPDYKLIPKYAKKLLKKNIILKKKYYTTEDYNKHFYGMTGNGFKFINYIKN